MSVAQPHLKHAPQRVGAGRIFSAFLKGFAASAASLGMRRGIHALTQEPDADAADDGRVVIRSRAAGADQGNGDQGPGQSRTSWLEEGKGFGKKFGNDWGMNLCSLLAYNFLGAIFPLLLGILALAALFLPAAVIHQIGTSLNGAIPAAANGQNGLHIDFNAVLDSFHSGSSSKITLIVSFLALLWTGSSLFGVMENCFSIIFRTKDRDFVWQKLMSVGMIVIFAIFTPLAFVASSISGSYQRLAQSIGDLPGAGIVFAGGGFLIGVAFAFALFFLIYLIVPNLKIAPSHAWRGALVAAIIFEAATLAFPIYTAHFMGKSQFGSIAGLLAVLTLWFWVISLILIVGAEVNSYFGLGQRATADDLPGVIHGLKVHGDMRAGEDATSHQSQQRVMEDVQPKAEKQRVSGEG